MNTAAHKAPLAVIAEDEETGRLLLAQSAAAVGLEPIVFDNGADALTFLLTHEVAMVLLDVEMPGLNGYEVCRHVRDIPRFASVPIVMVTGRDDKTAINRAFEAGATDFISKPVTWALLPHRLEYVMRNAGAVQALADREAKLRTLLEAIPDALWVVSPAGEPRWTPNEHAANTLFTSTLPEERRSQAIAVIRATATDGKRRHFGYRDTDPTRKSGSAELRFSRCDGGDVLVVRQDTTERTAAADHIERLAYFDTLTGLPNRQRLIETAQQLLSLAEASGDGLALVYLDLNSFKRINDAFGHSTGDAVLQRVAEILNSVVRRFATRPGELSLARFGGDEFVILQKDAIPREAAADLAAACCAALEKPIVLDHVEFLATPSVGIAIYPGDGDDVETLLKHADTAMYQAKAAGGPKVVAYTAAMSARLRDQLDLESRLRRTVRDGLLDLRYQPKFRVHDGSIAGVEALARWYDTEHGEVSPVRFIRVAEESDLIIDIGAWVIATVCKQIRGWLDLGIEMPVAINVSGKELLFGDPARIIEAQANKWGIPPSLIEIEITESVFVSEANEGRHNIEKLRGLGCRMALDDFGTGYSSFAYLTRFPPDRLKIDKSFVHEVDTSASDGAVVNAITSLAKTLGLTVTAEGVERQSQLDWLRARGCHEAQGFLLARPMTAHELETRHLLGANAGIGARSIVVGQ